MAAGAVEVIEALDRHIAVLRMVGDIDHEQLETLVADEMAAHLGPLDADTRKFVTTAVRLTVAHIVAGVTVAMDTA